MLFHPGALHKQNFTKGPGEDLDHEGPMTEPKQATEREGTGEGGGGRNHLRVSWGLCQG